MMQWGNLEPLIRQWGNWGELTWWPDDHEENRKLGPWWLKLWNIDLGAQFDDSMDKLKNSDDEIGAPWWPDGEIGGPRPLILFKRFDTAPLHSFKRMGPKFSEKFMQAKKEYIGPYFSIVPLIFQRLCDDY